MASHTRTSCFGEQTNAIASQLNFCKKIVSGLQIRYFNRAKYTKNKEKYFNFPTLISCLNTATVVYLCNHQQQNCRVNTPGTVPLSPLSPLLSLAITFRLAITIIFLILQNQTTLKRSQRRESHVGRIKDLHLYLYKKFVSFLKFVIQKYINLKLS
jgi:hypothetical protein